MVLECGQFLASRGWGGDVSRRFGRLKKEEWEPGTLALLSANDKRGALWRAPGLLTFFHGGKRRVSGSACLLASRSFILGKRLDRFTFYYFQYNEDDENEEEDDLYLHILRIATNRLSFTHHQSVSLSLCVPDPFYGHLNTGRVVSSLLISFPFSFVLAFILSGSCVRACVRAYESCR